MGLVILGLEICIVLVLLYIQRLLQVYIICDLKINWFIRESAESPGQFQPNK